MLPPARGSAHHPSVVTSAIARRSVQSLSLRPDAGQSVQRQSGAITMHVRPLHDRILVQRLEEGEQSIGGIIIPDSAKEKPQRGTVVAAGNGRQTAEGKRVALDIQTGDTILFGKYSGQEIKLDGVDYLIMKEDEVLAAIGAGLTNAGDSADHNRREKE
jgi:chaperonin GroES